MCPLIWLHSYGRHGFTIFKGCVDYKCSLSLILVQGLLYECLQQTSTTFQQGIPDDITRTTSEYSEIVHPQKVQEEPADTPLKLEKTKSPIGMYGRPIVEVKMKFT